MRVVGGKTGADGKLFAYIVWTVPGGPAEKGGLQQGDKILEWCGVSLVDRSFEEVCSIMDRTGEVAELLVEHASDFRMCDLFDDNPIQQQQQQQQQQPTSHLSNIPMTQRKNSEIVGLSVTGKWQHYKTHAKLENILKNLFEKMPNHVIEKKNSNHVYVKLNFLHALVFLESDSNDKSPSSPTRRKLPKTPV
jgi:PDZ domain